MNQARFLCGWGFFTSVATVFFVETIVVEIQCRLLNLAPDLIRCPEFAFEALNSGCRIKSGMTVNSFFVSQNASFHWGKAKTKEELGSAQSCWTSIILIRELRLLQNHLQHFFNLFIPVCVSLSSRKFIKLPKVLYELYVIKPQPIRRIRILAVTQKARSTWLFIW